MNSYFALFPNTAPWIVSLATFVLLVVVLYMARTSAHKLINTIFTLFYSQLRLGARSLAVTEQKLKDRNHDVLVALGKEQLERELNRDFFKINQFVERDLGGFPALQRKIQEQITAINEDYDKSSEIPVPSPEWIKAVESIAKLELKDNGTDLTEKIVSLAEEQHRDVLQNYRKSIGERHSILKGIAPYWRKLTHKVDQVGTHLQEMVDRSHAIDKKMAEFQGICEGSDKIERKLKASQLTQFLIASVALGIAIAGAFVNFHLIEFPLREMVDVNNRVLGFSLSDVAASVLLLLQVSLGILLMESLHVTRLLPFMSAMDDRTRIRFAWALGVLLIVVAAMSASLAFLRGSFEQYAMAMNLSTTLTLGSEFSWITLAVNMAMVFFITIVLAFVAIPLEHFFHSLRIVAGMLLGFLLRFFSLMMRFLANTIRYLSKIVIHCYDIIILVPLWLESLWLQKSSSEESTDSNETSSYTESSYAANYSQENSKKDLDNA